MGVKAVSVLIIALLFVLQASAQVLNMTIQQGVMFVSIKVNGKDAVMLVDTGATRTIIQPRVLGLTKQGLQSGQSGNGLIEKEGSVRAQVMRQADLRIGERKFNRQTVVVLDLSGEEKASGLRIDGLLGQDTLTQFHSVRINYKSKTLELGN